MEWQLQTHRKCITRLGITVTLLLVTAASAHAQIKVVQAVPITFSYPKECFSQDLTFGGYVGCYQLGPRTSTVSFSPTTSGNTLVVLSTGVGCTDSLGQTWQDRFNQSGFSTGVAPPPGAVTGGITSLTCTTSLRTHVTFFEISGAAPSPPSTFGSSASASTTSSGTAVCPQGLGADTVSVYFIYATAVARASCRMEQSTGTCGGNVRELAGIWSPVSASLSISPGAGSDETIDPIRSYQVWSVDVSYSYSSDGTLGYDTNQVVEGSAYQIGVHTPPTFSYTVTLTGTDPGAGPVPLSGGGDVLALYLAHSFSIAKRAWGEKIVVARARRSVWPLETRISSRLTLNFLA
jgi:hypothetical protein